MADQEVADLTAIASIDGDELLYVVDDPGGAPLDRKVTIDDLATYVNSGSSAAYSGARASHSANQTVATGGSGTIIAFNTEAFDAGTWHDTVTNNSRFTVPAGKSGYATAYFHFIWLNDASPGGDFKEVGVLVNGVEVLTFVGPPGSASDYNSVSGQVDLDVTAGDYVEFRLRHDEGNDITVLGTSFSGDPMAGVRYAGD